MQSFDSRISIARRDFRVNFTEAGARNGVDLIYGLWMRILKKKGPKDGGGAMSSKRRVIYGNRGKEGESENKV